MKVVLKICVSTAAPTRAHLVVTSDSCVKVAAQGFKLFHFLNEQQIDGEQGFLVVGGVCRAGLSLLHLLYEP